MPTTTTTEPAWCRLDHSVEPGDHHAARIELPGAELIVSHTPSDGLMFEVIGEPGATAESAVTFGPSTAVHLAGVLTRVAGSS